MKASGFVLAWVAVQARGQGDCKDCDAGFSGSVIVFVFYFSDFLS